MKATVAALTSTERVAPACYAARENISLARFQSLVALPVRGASYCTLAASS